MKWKIIMILSIVSTTLFAQISIDVNKLELLDSLELYLFPYNAPDEQQDILGVEQKRGSEQIYYAIGRKHQPNYSQAINVLEKIRKEGNKAVLPRFRKITQKHLELYKKEWMIYLSPIKRIQVGFDEICHKFPPHLERTLFSLETDSLFNTAEDRFLYAYKLLQDFKLKNNHRWTKVSSYIEENGVEFLPFILTEIQDLDFKDKGKDESYMSLLLSLRSINEPNVDSVLIQKLPLFENHPVYYRNTLFIISRHTNEVGMMYFLELLLKYRVN